MTFKIFSPVLLLAFFQLFFFWCYKGFSYEPEENIFLMVNIFYIIFILTIVFFCVCTTNLKNYKNISSDKGNKVTKFDLIFLLLVIVFINIPSILMFMMGLEFGFDYVRANFFQTDLIRSKAFGTMSIAIVVLNYLIPILWLYVIMMVNINNNRARNIVFYFILISLILFNFSFAGRFYLYFALLVLYFKCLIENIGVISFFLKKSIFLVILISISFLMTRLRSGEIVEESKDFLILLEYHILQPFFLSQKIQFNEINYNGYPFKTIIEGLLAPFSYLMGKGLNELPQGVLPVVFSNSTLYSNYSDLYFNAFGTFFPYIYIDFGFFSFLFIFIYFTLILFSCYLIPNREVRIKYLCFLSLMMYFSLFQSMIFSYGCLIIIVFFPILCRIYWKK